MRVLQDETFMACGLAVLATDAEGADVTMYTWRRQDPYSHLSSAEVPADLPGSLLLHD